MNVWPSYLISMRVLIHFGEWFDLHRRVIGLTSVSSLPHPGEQFGFIEKVVWMLSGIEKSVFGKLIIIFKGKVFSNAFTFLNKVMRGQVCLKSFWTTCINPKWFSTCISWNPNFIKSVTPHTHRWIHWDILSHSAFLHDFRLRVGILVDCLPMLFWWLLGWQFSILDLKL